MLRAKASIMTHMVASFPDPAASLDVAGALVKGGASYLEIQFPYSDPTADGPIIQEACSRALRRGFQLEDGFKLAEEIGKKYSVPVFIMSYAGPVYSRGVELFCRRAVDTGAAGLIVPDLPADSDEGLWEYCGKHGISAVPVLSPSSSAERIELYRRLKPNYVYAVLRSGITGAATEIGPENTAFLGGLKDFGAKICAGFGISSREQVEALSPYADTVVVGSALVRCILAALESSKGFLKDLEAKVKELVNGN